MFGDGMSVTNLEKDNLEAHVELCHVRYGNLEKRLGIIEEKVEKIHEDLVTGSKALMKVFIGASVTIIVGFMSTLIVILEKLG